MVGVILTHAHFDHIYGLPELLKQYPNCKIYTNESGRETLANAKKNMSFYHESPVTVDESYTTIAMKVILLHFFIKPPQKSMQLQAII